MEETLQVFPGQFLSKVLHYKGCSPLLCVWINLVEFCDPLGKTEDTAV